MTTTAEELGTSASWEVVVPVFDQGDDPARHPDRARSKVGFVHAGKMEVRRYVGRGCGDKAKVLKTMVT